MMISSLLQVNQAMLRQYCGEGDTVVDATMGNGKDTVFLARLVGEEGLVLALDRQAEAVATTGSLLDVMDLLPRAKLVQADHAGMADIIQSHIPPAWLRLGLAAAVFNLGFLPGGRNKSLTTGARSTIIALDAVWPHIRPGGMLSVHTYTGHPGGNDEAENVSRWMKNILWKDAQVTACAQHNKLDNLETLFFAVKKDA